jgi:hypothetical protein
LRRIKQYLPVPQSDNEDHWPDVKRISFTNLMVLYSSLSQENDKDRRDFFIVLWSLLVSDIEWIRTAVYLACGAAHPNAFAYLIESLLTWVEGTKKKGKLAPLLLRCLRGVTQERGFSARLVGPPEVIASRTSMFSALIQFWKWVNPSLQSLSRYENGPTCVNSALSVSNIFRSLVIPSVFPLSGPLRICHKDHFPGDQVIHTRFLDSFLLYIN